jgi:hypothetical protein
VEISGQPSGKPVWLKAERCELKALVTEMKIGVLLLCVVLTAGCGWRKRPQTVAAAPAPPKPKPAPASTPPPPPAPAEPLSIPQTEARLPQPQPIPPEALATAELPAPPKVDVPAPKPGRVAGTPQLPPAPKAEPETPGPEAGPRIGTLLSQAERRKLTESIAARRREIQQIVQRLEANSPNAEKREAIDRVHSFLSLANQAEERGDLRQADSLLARALLLAKSLMP